MSGHPVRTYCSIEVAAHLSGLTTPRVRRLVRAGLVRPTTMERGRPLFDESELARMRKIRRLTTELGVNLAGVEVILRLTEELAALRSDLSVENP